LDTSVSALTFTIGIASVIALGCAIDAHIWHKRGLPNLYRFFLLGGELRIRLYTTAAVAANLSVGNFIVFVAIWGHRFGTVGAVCFVGNLVLNVLGFTIFFPRFRAYIEDTDNNGSIHDYLARAYTTDPYRARAKLIRFTASFVTIVCLTLAIVFELSLAVQLLAPDNWSLQIKYFAGLAFLIGLFTAYGGFRTLVISDRANATVLTVATILLCCVMWYFWRWTPNAPPISLRINWSDLKYMGWPRILSISVIGFGWMLVSMDEWQRTCAARSYSTSKKGMLIYLPIVSLFAIAFAFWGAFDRSVLPLIVGGSVSHDLSGAQNPLLDITALPVASDMSRALVAFIISGLIFAAISTTNTFLTVCSCSFTADILVGTRTNAPITKLDPIVDEFYVGVARSVIVAMVALIFACFVAFTLKGWLIDPFRFFFIAYSVQFALLPSVIMSALAPAVRPSSGAVLISLVTGFIASLFLGFGAWFLAQVRTEPILSLPPDQWLPLAPVATIILGFVPLISDTATRLLPLVPSGLQQVVDALTHWLPVGRR
jgi:Na+/pantothenate symporter